MDWSFNKSIAEIFNSHARQHIPDYDKVIDLSVDLCVKNLQPNDPILEIGCAVGETVTRLHSKGFTNIHAVDASQDMLDKCPKDLATYYCSSQFPTIDIKYKAIICNWTLHFIKEKPEYLKQIFNSLETNGLLVLTDKTANKGIALDQYHNFKRSAGVTDEQIKAKAASVKNIMFIDPPEWYLWILQTTGFKDVCIASANWCFTTFVACKNN